jgi:hypothetical protein
VWLEAHLGGSYLSNRLLMFLSSLHLDDVIRSPTGPATNHLQFLTMHSVTHIDDAIRSPC